MIDKALGDDPSHNLGGVVFSLPAVETQRECKRLCDVVGGRWREVFGLIWHDDTRPQWREQDKNDWLASRTGFDRQSWRALIGAVFLVPEAWRAP